MRAAARRSPTSPAAVTRARSRRDLVDGRPNGGALSFDGVNDWVTVADAAALDLTNAMTLEAWVARARPTAGAPSLKEQTGRAGLRPLREQQRPARERDLWLGSGEIEARSAARCRNAWTHLAATYDGAIIRLYVNGALPSTTATGSMPPRPARSGSVATPSGRSGSPA